MALLPCLVHTFARESRLVVVDKGALRRMERRTWPSCIYENSGQCSDKKYLIHFNRQRRLMSKNV